MTATTSNRENSSHSHSHSHSYSLASRQESLNRNTLNQRASRARRKDYVASLELKVREYEARGVQATEQVQNAARHVAEENRVLKEEMRMLREQVRCLEEVLSRREIRPSGNGEGDERDNGLGDRDAALDAAWRRLQHEDRLRGWGQQQQRQQDQQHQYRDHEWQDQSSDSTLLAVDTEIPADVVESQYPSPPGESREGKGSPHRHLHRPTKAVHSVKSPDEPEFTHASIASFDTYHDIDTDDDALQSTLDDDISHLTYHPFSNEWVQGQGQGQGRRQGELFSQPSRPPLRTLPANTTPCEEAALIIASMRGIATSNADPTADILPELGCHNADTSRSCTVDNARLFGIMDADRG
ncbi:uncharacterized protein A1O9_00102 [Exophiala aquamarina CBS 119918]|uniref:BZIP domain-containing protein n=1 Tax=Exophiala aquamarina CBS 119918 TaxID=1182545 RepID=A0A072Q2J8_9EURO|nr:uncharacterized protein A1O9_00102 [Exophiala aquamarina CBS 119918]KEF62130.1 hypothetical protein A1O9_00102 [Exophiala aquamarina CBS 119918]